MNTFLNKKLIVTGLFLFFICVFNAQHETRIYHSATIEDDQLRIVFKDNAVATIDVFSLESQKWMHTKVIDSDITQEYMKLVILPSADTLELYRDIYFEKIVVENNRNQKMTYWLEESPN